VHREERKEWQPLLLQLPSRLPLSPRCLDQCNARQHQHWRCRTGDTEKHIKGNEEIRRVQYVFVNHDHLSTTPSLKPQSSNPHRIIQITTMQSPTPHPPSAAIKKKKELHRNTNSAFRRPSHLHKRKIMRRKRNPSLNTRSHPQTTQSNQIADSNDGRLPAGNEV